MINQVGNLLIQEQAVDKHEMKVICVHEPLKVILDQLVCLHALDNLITAEN